MLETIREYAAERLEESGERDEIMRRQLVYLAELAEATETENVAPAEMELHERFRTEWENVRSAIGWAVENGETELGLRLAGSLTTVWLDRNVAVEGQRWFRELLENAQGVDRFVRAKALVTASTVTGVRGDIDLAIAWSEEALAEFRELGYEPGIAWTLANLAIAPLEEGRPDEARAMLEEAEALHLKLNSPRGMRRVRHLLGQQAFAAGDVERSRRLLRESTDLSLDADDKFGAASSLHTLGDVELASAAIEAAEAAYEGALRLAWDSSSDRLVCYCLAGLGAVAAEQGRADRAALLWGFAEAYEERLRFTMRWRSEYAQRLEPVAAAHPEQREAGRQLSLDDAVEAALSPAS